MKKAVAGILAVMLCVGLLSGCRKTGGDLKAGVYLYGDSGEAAAPCVQLKENGGFLFFYSMLSSYIARGTYQAQDGTLTLSAENNDREYLFEIKDGALVFDKENSSDVTLGGKETVPDGAKFTFTEVTVSDE